MAAQRIYRTVDGRHVPEGHADAAFLAYTQYDEVPGEVTDELKHGRKPADKQAAKPADKAIERPRRRAKSSQAPEGDSSGEE